MIKKFHETCKIYRGFFQDQIPTPFKLERCVNSMVDELVAMQRAWVICSTACLLATDKMLSDIFDASFIGIKDK